MVEVITFTGNDVAAQGNIDLAAFARGPVARLVSARLLRRAAQTVLFTGSAAGIVFTGSAIAGHRHPLYVETSNPGSAVGASLPIGQEAGGLLKIQTPVETSFPTAIETIADFTPAGTIPNLTPVGTIGAIGGIGIQVLTVMNNGLLNMDATAPAAASIVLSDRREVNIGVALTSTDFLELNVLYMGQTGGVF